MTLSLRECTLVLSEVQWVESRSDFDDLLSEEDFLVVDFTAPSWCVPCQRFAPHFDKAAENASVQSSALGRTTFVAVDVDKAPWAVADYGVQGVPSVRLYNGLTDTWTDLRERTVVKLLSEIQNSI